MQAESNRDDNFFQFLYSIPHIIVLPLSFVESLNAYNKIVGILSGHGHG